MNEKQKVQQNQKKLKDNNKQNYEDKRIVKEPNELRRTRTGRVIKPPDRYTPGNWKY